MLLSQFEAYFEAPSNLRLLMHDVFMSTFCVTETADSKSKTINLKNCTLATLHFLRVRSFSLADGWVRRVAEEIPLPAVKPGRICSLFNCCKVASRTTLNANIEYLPVSPIPPGRLPYFSKLFRTPKYPSSL